MAGSPSSMGSGTGKGGAGRGQHLQPASPRSVSSRSENPVVSGLGLSGSSRSASPPPAACAPELADEKDAVGCVPVQDRLVWRDPQPSRKTMWHHRKAAQCEAEAAVL
jgi:hypothetical protein